ncbi:hypothetical protein II582_01115 [bacterium]|nr:hypothetical protein [bacterium]
MHIKDYWVFSIILVVQWTIASEPKIERKQVENLETLLGELRAIEED